MTPDQAADLAARTFAAIRRSARFASGVPTRMLAADRRRVASDLVGLQECHHRNGDDYYGVRDGHREHAARYADGLRRTARLYGVTE